MTTAQQLYERVAALPVPNVEMRPITGKVYTAYLDDTRWRKFWVWLTFHLFAPPDSYYLINVWSIPCSMHPQREKKL